MQSDFVTPMDQPLAHPISMMPSQPKKTKPSLKAKAWTCFAVLCLLLVAAVVLAVYFATRSQACPKDSCQSSCKALWDATTNLCVNDVSACESTCQGEWNAQSNVCNNTVSDQCKDSCTELGLVWKEAGTTPLSGTCTIDFVMLKGTTGEFTSGTSSTPPLCVASNSACLGNTTYDSTSNTCASTCQDSCKTYGVQWVPSSSSSPTSGSCTVDLTTLKGSTGEFTQDTSPKCVANLTVLTGPTGSTGEFTQDTPPTCVASANACTEPTTYNSDTHKCEPPPSSCTSCQPARQDTSDPSTWVSCSNKECIGSAKFNIGMSCKSDPSDPSVGYQPSLDAVLTAMNSKIAPGTYPIAYITSPNPKDPNGQGSFTYSLCPSQTVGTNNFTPTTGSFGEYMVVFNPFGNIAGSKETLM